MKLSEITTADALIMHLARLGYTKVADLQSCDAPSTSKGLFSYRTDLAASPLLVVMPLSPENKAGKAGFAASFDIDGNVLEWSAFEISLAKPISLDPKSHFESIEDWAFQLASGD